MESEFIKSFSYTDIWPGNKETPNEWQTRTGHVSGSALKLLKQSPAHFIEPKDPDDEETKAKLFGSAYHCFILEPLKFEEKYFIFDDRDIIEKLIGEGSKNPRNTNAYKEWKDAQLSFAQGKIMIDLETKKVLEAMKSRLFSHRYVAQLLSDGEAEKSFYCTLNTMDDKEVKVIMRTDYLKWKKRAVIELKTTKDASKEGFPKECGQYDYHISSALYKDFMELIQGDGIPWSFFFIAQESKKPYAFNIFEASAQFIAQGRYEYEQLIMLFNQCKENNKWPGYQVWTQNRFGVNEINLPNWAVQDLTFYNHK